MDEQQFVITFFMIRKIFFYNCCEQRHPELIIECILGNHAITMVRVWFLLNKIQGILSVHAKCIWEFYSQRALHCTQNSVFPRQWLEHERKKVKLVYNF